MSSAHAMRLAARAILIGAVGLGGCHGATIHEADAGLPTGAGGHGGSGTGSGGSGTGGNGNGGTTTGSGGASGTAGSGGLPKTSCRGPGRPGSLSRA
jgi:hypothetical protein